MTNEEKINLRERAYALATRTKGLLPSEMMKEAEKIYRFLLGDSEISEPEKISEENNKIDWSRPQLVVSQDDNELIVRTTGEHFEDVFTGFSADDGDIPEKNYKKRQFKYYGEIPEKISEENKEIDWSWTTPRLVRSKRDANIILETTGRHTQDMFEGIERMPFRRYGWFPKEGYRYHGEITLEQKTEGLNFMEAIQACKAGKNIRRPAWDDGEYLYHSNTLLYCEDGQIAYLSDITEILATDWQIVK